MGICLGSPSDGSDDRSGGGIAVGKSQPLQHRLPEWKSDTPMTNREISQKRAEFWETAPAFEGRGEIWQALKAACEAVGEQDFDLAQAIVDGANISLPLGTLSDVYDELGNRYIVPQYCITVPVNIIDTGENEVATAAATADASAPATAPGASMPAATSSGEDVVLKFRLSTLKDVKLTVKSSDTLAIVKYKLGRQEDLDGKTLRLFMSGKQLNDKLTVAKLKIPKGFFIQVLVPS